MRSTVCGAVLATALGLLATRARAADPAEVEALIQQGNTLRRQHKESQAFPLLRKAYDLSSTPRTAAQLGLVEMDLSYLLEAERHLSEALAATHDLWVQKNRQTLAAALERVTASIGVLSIAGGPPGAEVQVNGRDVGRFPLEGPVRVAEGPAQVEIRAPGFLPQSRSVSVVGGTREHIVIDLRPRDPGAPAVPSTTGATAVAASPDPPEAGRWRLGPWVLAGAAAGALGFGLLGHVRWQEKRADFNDHSLITWSGSSTKLRFDCGEDEPARGGPECQRIYDGLRRARARAIGGYAAAGLLAAASAILFRLGPERPQATAALACGGFGPRMGASCRVGF
jgi:hypothetical protein